MRLFSEADGNPDRVDEACNRARKKTAGNEKVGNLKAGLKQDHDEKNQQSNPS